MIGAIKTLRKLETKPTLFNYYRNGYSVSNLNGNTLPQTSLKQEPQQSKLGHLLTECHNKERF
ncbi:hypothetical protein [Helicobacter pylori]|uniref:hypothetical protein n=1 Tax=Helicobacter pylori TaxID=210 RepID=UPI001F0C12BB|nr:hypothetical protein [Helicobacter pylori]